MSRFHVRRDSRQRHHKQRHQDSNLPFRVPCLISVRAAVGALIGRGGVCGLITRQGVACLCREHRDHFAHLLAPKLRSRLYTRVATTGTDLRGMGRQNDWSFQFNGIVRGNRNSPSTAQTPQSKALGASPVTWLALPIVARPCWQSERTCAAKQVPAQIKRLWDNQRPE